MEKTNIDMNEEYKKLFDRLHSNSDWLNTLAQQGDKDIEKIRWHFKRIQDSMKLIDSGNEESSSLASLDFAVSMRTVNELLDKKGCK